MKILVTFYSRTGNTKKVGEEIAKILKADIDQIIDEKDRKGLKGYFGGGKDALMKNKSRIKYDKKPESYDLVIIGTPVWAGTMAPAVRTYLSENKFEKVAFFCTYGSGFSRAFSDMEKITRKPVATFGIGQIKVKSGEYSQEIEDFCKKLMK
ncbi:MAG: hypothetical protein GF368_05190 [Candidatus Aenigmarchaeota archaeon]|nr:hypothetical protein [Candidatus Aenigmarchaeota archaeon]